MAFTSYAQNGEDIVLWRALRDVTAGFYIDIGAFDPTEHSVTRAFYDAGWTGINIEPVPEYHAKFVIDRYRDLNLNIAVGKTAGLLEISAIAGTGLSTARPDYAAQHVRAGYGERRIVVPCLASDSVFEHANGRDVHFLKVDVEGMEIDVFAGLDLQKHRPWIILAEATEPNSEIRSEAPWVGMLTQNGYERVYFDGLNLFFLAEEQAHRRAELAKPPNVFDRFTTHQQRQDQDRLAELAEARAQLHGQVKALESERDGLREQIASLRHETESLRQALAKATAQTAAELRDELDRARLTTQEALAGRQRLEVRIAELEAHAASMPVVRAQIAGLGAMRRDLLRLLAISASAQAVRARAASGLGRALRSRSALRGHVDLLMDGVVSGWAWNARRPAEPVVVQARIGTRVVGTQPASAYREDLKTQGFGEGCCAFHLTITEDGIALIERQPCTLVIEALGATPLSLAIFEITPDCTPPGLLRRA